MPKGKHRGHKISRMIDDVINERERASNVTVAPPIDGSPVRLKSVKVHLYEIQELDPISFLGKVMNGEPIPVHTIDEFGKVKTEYDNASLKDRRQAAQFLAGKLTPTMHAHQVFVKEGEAKDDESVAGAFKRIVERAIDKQNRTGH